MAGLPGTGIGALLYILLAFWMILVEMVKCFRTRSVCLRDVYPLLGMALSMLAMIWLVTWGYLALLPPGRLLLPGLLVDKVAHPYLAPLISVLGITSALLILALLMLALHIARRVYRTRAVDTR